MPLSLLYRLVRCLLGLLAVLVRSDLSEDAELLVLRHENQVLRRQQAGRLRWGHADQVWLTALLRLVSRRRWPEVFPVAPATILRWHRDLVARKCGTTPAGADQDGRPPGLGQGAGRPDGARVARSRGPLLAFGCDQS